ncbi:MAG: DUF4345 family protein [Mycobacterium sp.]
MIGFGPGYIGAFQGVFGGAADSPGAVRLLAGTLALLGVSRLISMADVGMPHPAFTASCVIELAAAGLIYWYATLTDQRTADPGLC